MRGHDGGDGVRAAELAAASLRLRLADMRLEILRLRSSRRTLMALLEMETRRRQALERRVERLRGAVRALRRGRRRGADGGGG
jgi:hypothetical protein